MVLFSFMPKYIEKVNVSRQHSRNHIITGGFIFHLHYLSLLKEISALNLFDFQIMTRFFTETQEPQHYRDHFMS